MTEEQRLICEIKKLKKLLSNNNNLYVTNAIKDLKEEIAELREESENVHRKPDTGNDFWGAL